MSFLIRYSYYFLFLSFLLSQENADHLTFNRVCITPDEAEMIEIYNPLDESIDLSNYYLSDSNKYYKWISGESIGNFDFFCSRGYCSEGNLASEGGIIIIE